MQVGNYYLKVEETHGSIDHTYKCTIVDGLFDVGSGNTKRDAILSCANIVLREAKRLMADLEKAIAQEDGMNLPLFSASAFNSLRAQDKWTNYKRPGYKFICPMCKERTYPKRAVPFSGAEVECSNMDCEYVLTRRTNGGQCDPFEWIMIE
jgi:hypothetical protein